MDEYQNYSKKKLEEMYFEIRCYRKSCRDNFFLYQDVYTKKMIVLDERINLIKKALKHKEDNADSDLLEEE